MAHKHSVYDTDTHFIIDGVTRAVKNASSTKTMVVQHDHNSERFTFEIPRKIDDHDMSTCNAVQVHYLNIDSQTKAQNSGVYAVTDLQISPDSDDVVICSWLISGNATKYVGNLSFVVRFMCISDDGSVDYVWNTAVHSSVSVSTGIYNGDDIVEEYADILAQWEERIQVLEQGGASDEQIAQAVSDYLDKNPVQAGATAEQAAQITQNKNDIANIQQNKVGKSGWGANKYLGTDASGNVVAKDAPEGGGTVTDEQIASAVEEYMAENPVSEGGLSSTASELLIMILRNGLYNTDQSANITALAAELGVTEEEEPDVPVVPDEPDTEKTLSSISAVYSGDSVAVGTAVSELTGIVVTAHYSDGTSEAVTGYTLSGTIAEGSNTITVSYGGKTTTFTVTGVAESGGEATENPFDSATWSTGRYYYAFNADGTDKYNEMADKSYSNLIDISGYNNVVVEDLENNIKQVVVLFYDADSKGISTDGGFYRQDNTPDWPSPRFMPIPENAVYCRLCLNTVYITGSKFYVT